ncbi:MAG: MarR family transcriptional regulator [Ignavibacteriaceae bacterium]|nr:MarR family transcriptional regulator [Ignavibacteriaceae bacterium]
MGTNHKGSEKEINTLNSFIKLVRAYESLSSRLYMFFEQYDLTESQFYALDVLYNLGELNQKELGKKICRSEGNITMVVNNLLKRKLIEKKQSGDDKRMYIIKLTGSGNDLYEKVFPEFLKSLLFEFKNIKWKEQLEFQKVCKKIGLKNFRQQMPNTK